MSAQVTVVHKTAEIDGKPIKWNVLAITSYIGGDFQTLELKLNKTEALLCNMLLGSDENAPTTESHHSTEAEKNDFDKKTTREKKKTILEEDDELDGALFN